jgi:hypothetical protein
MTAYMRIAAVIVAGASLFGCATTADNAKSKPAVSAAAQDPNCLTDTGSRIAVGPATGAAGGASAGVPKCRGYGRSYSSTDIDRTGQINAADALGLLDPAITVHR